MAVVAFYASYLLFLIVWATLLSAPVIVALVLLRARTTERLARGVLAASFAVGVFYVLYRVEWFDVWRHGVPSGSYLLGYAPYLLVGAAVGWWAGSLLPARRDAASRKVPGPV